MGISPVSAPEGFQRASEKPFGAPLSLVRDGRADSGADGGAAAPRGAVLSFEAKESTKESTRHGDYGKKASIAHFGGGARNVARNEVGQLPPALGARSCSPFSAVKMGGPFSLRCLSPLCFAAGGAGQTQTAMLGMLRCDRDDSTARKNRLDFYSVVGINRTQIMPVGLFRRALDIPETQKASGVSNPRWLFMRAMRPVAEWRSFLFN